MSVTVTDRDLIKKSFRLMAAGVENVTVRDHLNKDLYYNFFSSSPGDNRYVNPLPQFSPAADPRFTQFMPSKEGGMGTQYKRVFDDNASLVTITPGVPEFTGLLTFITNMFDPVAAVMANKGRTPGFMFYVGQAVGTIAFAPIQLISIGTQFIYWLANTPKNQFYYVKPSVGLYMQSANNLLNDIMVSLGAIKPLLPMTYDDTAPVNGIDPSYKTAYQEEVARLSKTFGDVVNEDGTIDLARMMTRGVRKFRHFVKEVKKLDDADINSPDEKLDAIETKMKNFRPGDGNAYDVPLKDFLDKELNTVGRIRGDGTDEPHTAERHSAYLDKDAYENARPPEPPMTSRGDGTLPGLYGNQNVTGDTPPSSNNSSSAQSPSHPGDSERPPYTGTTPNIYQVNQDQTTYEDNTQDRSWMGDIVDLLETSLYGGFDAITFRHEHNGAVSDSFSNTSTQSPMAGKFNSAVKSVNDFRFDMADLQTGISPIDGILNMARDAVAGISSSAAIVNIPLALTNNTHINIPEHWSESSANLHRETYKFEFKATYATLYSQVTTMWAPFCMLLPLIFPNSAGGSAQTSPFLCKVFSKGRQVIRTGMVESATIRFGDGVGGWTKDRKCLNITVELTFVDMEKYISLPITRASGLLASLTNPAAAVSRMLTDVGPYNAYLARITGTDYLDTVLRWSQLSRRLTTQQVAWKQSVSPGNIAGMVTDSVIGDISKVFVRPISR
ncbi:hypothetical protein FDJ25_gp008 [Vibrio phage Aphrodite1]|uniref:Uncharacterized protein n=1 Tax=Vibrio phage Aphrodite1 TaxID=2070057 RepID=A0A2I7QHQ5_9CAUD|nr:hypothetical protein FDJ25_gp008 [Vibrio phage Aphrodite1]AUR80924.1 hypothetical protein Aphrodite1_0202 [Vibrio phage Aphrodite1]